MCLGHHKLPRGAGVDGQASRPGRDAPKAHRWKSGSRAVRPSRCFGVRPRDRMENRTSNLCARLPSGERIVARVVDLLVRFRAPSQQSPKAPGDGRAPRTADVRSRDSSIHKQEKKETMPKEARLTIPQMETATFDQLKMAKIALRRAGRKDGVRYANVEAAMKRRFGRT